MDCSRGAQNVAALSSGRTGAISIMLENVKYGSQPRVGYQRACNRAGIAKIVRKGQVTLSCLLAIDCAR